MLVVEAGLAPTSLNPTFTSRQQQEALPDETEVVEETVAEVAEVGGEGPGDLSANIHSLGNPDGAAGAGHCSPSHVHAQDKCNLWIPNDDTRVLPKSSLEPHRWEL